MFCPKCGATFESGTQFCGTCGEPLPQLGAPAPSASYGAMRSPGPDPAVKVPNYLVQAILTTLCCCMPFGIVAIVYASQANSKSQVGDIEGALAAAKNANMWSWLSFASGAVITIVYILLMALGYIAGEH